MKKSSVSLESKKDNYAIPPKAADSTVPATPKVIAKPVASSKSAPSADAVATPPRKTKAIQKDEAVVSFRGVVDTNSEDDAVITKKLTLKKNLTLKNALESLLEDEDVKLPSRDISVEIKYPLPRRQVDDKTLKM